MKFEYSFHYNLEQAKQSGLGSGARIQNKCQICGFTRTDMRHKSSCSRKMQAMFAPDNLPKKYRKTEDAINRAIKLMEDL